MIKYNNSLILLLCAAALVGCSADNEIDNEIRSPIQQEWKAVAQAAADSIVENEDAANEGENNHRALFYGGNSLRFYTLWDKGDVVTVYKNNVSVGTMEPETWGTMSTTLTGTLTGSFAVNDVLDVWRPSANMVFTGQKGTVNDLSQNFIFQHTTATVLQASNQILTISDVNPIHQQGYLRFVLLNEAGTERLHPTRLELHAISGGHIAQSVAADGTVTPCDVLTIEPEEENGEYPGELFVALLNDANTKVTYRIKAHVGEDIYVGPVDIAGQSPLSINMRSYLGSLNRILRKMRLTTPASALTISDIPAYTFTGSPIVPDASEVVVKDGDKVLTQGIDYSYAFTNNTNAGEATITITGLAMNGSLAATKYLGTKTKTFTIERAQPIVVLDDAVMKMEVGQSLSRVVSRVFIDNNANGTWDAGTDYDITSMVSVGYRIDSGEGVAEVVSYSGQVTGVAAGEATVMAYIVGNSNFKEASATYHVMVGTVGSTNVINEWGSGDTTDETVHY